MGAQLPDGEHMADPLPERVSDQDERANRGPATIIEDLFSYHQPGDAENPKYRGIRTAAIHLIKTIDHHCPPCPDRTAAVRDIRKGVMMANASIALRGASYR